MNDTLKLLYDRFYITLPMPAAEAEIEICHRQLIEHLEKPDRKLILRIIDAQNLIAEKRSIDSFIVSVKTVGDLSGKNASAKL